MKIVYDFPPNIDLLRRVFPLEGRTDVIFAYGGAVWNPGHVVMTDALKAHEQVHLDRQGDDPDGWWARYVAEPKFRFAEEAPAHAAESAVMIRAAQSRPERQLILKAMAKKLGAPLYGGRSYGFALKLLREGGGSDVVGIT